MKDSERLEKLKELLLTEDRDFAHKILDKLDKLEATLNTKEQLSEKVNPIIDNKLESFTQDIPKKLGNTIVKTIQVEMKKSQDSMVDVLYPIVGKMIKKYIQQEIKLLSEKIDKSVKQTFSLRTWKRKIISFFSGVSEKDIALSELATPKVEQVFIIEKYSGILLAEKSKNETDIDKDMIAGMLTAIKSFVEDAFVREDQSLELIQYELFTIYIQNLSSYYVAVVISGSYTSEFSSKIETIILETLADNRNKKITQHATITKKLTSLLFDA